MGNAAIVLAFLAAVVAVVSAIAGAASPHKRTAAKQIASVAVVSSAVVAGLAVCILGRALWIVDPASAYVERHSSQQTPLAYRIAGIWGGMEGSLLFWSFVVACTFAAATVLMRSRRSDEVLAISGVGGFTIAGFLAVSRTWASPFEALDVPTGSGNGLLAVLQHPAMVYHPPILYLGLALTSVPFALTLLALMQRRLDHRWRATVVPWLRAGWLILGVGIITGSQWAYAELGWGGFWAWDPVENSSLLPWLATTIALHMLVEPSGRLAVSGASAILGAFCLMVCGVYVTRSGNTGSIHAFSESPEVGRPLLAFAGVTAIVSIGALVRQTPGPVRLAWNRPNVLGVQAMLGAVAVTAIALGTFWPVVDGLVFSSSGPRALVRPDYYHRALAPVAALSLIAMAVGPSIAARTTRTAERRRLLLIGIFLGAALALALAVAAVGSTGWLTLSPIVVTASAGASVGGSIAYVVTTPTPRRLRRRIGIALAHGGFALMMLGAVASSGGTDTTVRIDVGQTIELASTDGTDEQITLVDLATGQADRYEYVRGIVDVQHGQDRERYGPELRAYESQRLPTAEAVIEGAFTGDTIVVLESVAEDLGSATFTVRTRPLLPWVWAGGLLVVAGGLATLAGRQPMSSDELDAVPDPAATARPR